MKFLNFNGVYFISECLKKYKVIYDPINDMKVKPKYTTNYMSYTQFSHINF